MSWVTASTYEVNAGMGMILDWTPVWASEFLIYIFFTDTDADDGTHNLYALEAYFDGETLTFINSETDAMVIHNLSPVIGRIRFAQRTPSGYGVFCGSDISSDASTMMFAINDPVEVPNYQLDDQPCSWRGDELVGYLTDTGPVVFGTLTDLYGIPVPMNDTLTPDVTTDATASLIETAGSAVFYLLHNLDLSQMELWRCSGATATLLAVAPPTGGTSHSVDNKIEIDPRILNLVETEETELVGLIADDQLTHSADITTLNRWWTGVWHGMVQNVGYTEQEQPPDITPPPVEMSMPSKPSTVDPGLVIAFSFDPESDDDVIGLSEWLTASLEVSGAPGGGVIKFYYFDGGGLGPTLIGTGDSQPLFDADDSITDQLDTAYRHDFEAISNADWLFVQVEHADEETGDISLVELGGMTASITWEHQPSDIPGDTVLPIGEYLFSGVAGASDTSTFSPDPNLGATGLRSGWFSIVGGRYTAVAAPMVYGVGGEASGSLAIHFVAEATGDLGGVRRRFFG